MCIRDSPPEFGMKNLLRSQFGLETDQAALAYRTLMDSADQAKFFATRGTRTHLIVPQLSGTASQGATDEGTGTPIPPTTAGGNGGTTTGPTIRTAAADSDVLKAAKAGYVNTLVEMLKEHSRGGQPDSDLMDRIERVLNEAKV